MKPEKTPFFTELKNRGQIKIKGKGAEPFLQGLITNDIHLLEREDCIYACLLTPQGKFLYDFFITKEPEMLILDCEGGERTNSLTKALSMYRLRTPVEIESHPETSIYAIMNSEYGHKDPRHPNMGYRSFEKPTKIPERPFEEWDYHRISLCVPDGSRDLIIGKSTMDEGNMDQLNAISYDKGCYIGQELTARMHYRGLGKKKLKTVRLDNAPEKAELRSSCKDLTIALVKKNKIQPA